LRLSIAFGAFAAFNSSVALAQPADIIRKSPDWSKATVVTDGGSVYTAPDFDAKIADYLAFKTPLYITKKAIPGHGGLGLFHRVRYKSKSGFMADTDIRVTNSKETDPASEKDAEKISPEAKKARSKAFHQDDEERSKSTEPMFYRRYVGGALAMVDFSEKFQGTKFNSEMLMYGLRATGPGIIFASLPLDFNLWFSLKAPGYYGQFPSTTAKGFLLFGDLSLTLPFYEWGHNLVYYGLGMMYTYTKFNVQIKNSFFDSQEVRLGGVFSLGYGHKFGSFAVRADARYYYERTQYLGYLGSFQMEY
jgi:hypothetical protein